MGIVTRPAFVRIVLTVAVLVAGSTGAQAAVGLAVGGGCINPVLGPVTVLMDTRVTGIAAAGIDSAARPVIRVNPDQADALAPATRLFLAAHECAHHRLGHLTGQPGPAPELEADCLAIRVLAARGWLTPGRLTAIMTDVARLPGSRVHPPGPVRAMLLRPCLALVPTG